MGRLMVEVRVSIDGDDPTRVNATGTFGLRDWSGDWDDNYEGVIYFTVVAE